MTLTCQCCGFAREFQDGEEAFRAGWDAPPHFTRYISCDLCPGSFIVLGQTVLHAADHARWQACGRPDAFQFPRDANGDFITAVRT